MSEWSLHPLTLIAHIYMHITRTAKWPKFRNQRMGCACTERWGTLAVNREISPLSQKHELVLHQPKGPRTTLRLPANDNMYVDLSKRPRASTNVLSYNKMTDCVRRLEVQHFVQNFESEHIFGSTSATMMASKSGNACIDSIKSSQKCAFS